MPLDRVAGDSVEERLAAAEAALAAIEFDTLPLRKLRDFMENEAVFNATTNIFPGSGTIGEDGAPGATGAAGAAGQAGTNNLLYFESGIFVPSWAQFTTLNITGNVNRAKPQGTRFTAGKDLTCGHVLLGLEGYSSCGASDTVEVGIYNADASSRLAVSSLIQINTLHADNAERWDSIALGSSVALTSGTVYTLVVNYHGTPPAGFTVLGCDASAIDSTTLVERNTRYKNADSYTAAGRLKYAETFLCGDTYASLPADLTVGVSGASGSAGPIGVLLT